MPSKHIKFICSIWITPTKKCGRWNGSNTILSWPKL